MAELINHFEADIQSIMLIPADRGQFEVTVNDSLIYSKLATHRHAEIGEVSTLVNQYLQDKRE